MTEPVKDPIKPMTILGYGISGGLALWAVAAGAAAALILLTEAMFGEGKKTLIILSTLGLIVAAARSVRSDQKGGDHH